MPPSVNLGFTSKLFSTLRAGELLDTLRRIGEQPEVFILRLRLAPLLDTTWSNALRHVVEKCVGQGIQVIFAGTQPQPMQLLNAIGPEPGSSRIRHMTSYDEAITLARDLSGHSREAITVDLPAPEVASGQRLYSTTT